MATKRKKKEPKPDPNPLFKQWIREWRDEADKKGWKTKYVYAKALKSLEQFPLVLKSGKEAIILDSFGEKICKMLDDKLSEYKASGGITVSSGPLLSVDSDSDESIPNTCSSTASTVLQASQTGSPSKNGKPVKKRAGKQYVPAFRSGAYAILIALHNAEVDLDQKSLKKVELIQKAEPLCDASFTLPNPGSHYTAWSCMGTVIKKELVSKEGSPARYSLTEIGRELAMKLVSIPNPGSPRHGVSTSPEKGLSQSQPILSSQSSSTSSSQFSSIQCSQSSSMQCSQSSLTSQEQNIEKYTLEPGTFQVVLCVDNCETAGGGSAAASRKQMVVQELQKNGVNFEVRKLHVGDFLWVAKERVQPIPGMLRIPEPRELVLDFVVERKRMDDLAQSIKDGRFHEQKFRLQNSGVRRPVYLVEDFGNDSYNYGISRKALFQAINNTQIINGFMIKQTKDQKDSVGYLTLMSRALSRTYSDQRLESCSRLEMKQGTCPSNAFLTFKEFNTSSMKNKVMTAKDMFIKQLLQLSGLSVDKALAITKLYDTPSKLLAAYENCETEKEKENLLSGIKYGQNKRNVGSAISKVLYRFYATDFTLS